MSRFKCVIFDMDGTLIDSEKFYRKGFIQAFGSNGYIVTDDDVKIFAGMTGEKEIETIDGFTNNRQMSMKIHHEMLDQTALLFEREVAPLKEGAKELLDFCKENGLKIGLATATHEKKAISRLSAVGILDYFDFLCFGNDTKRPKPAPDIYQLAIEKSEFTASECMAVEDSPSGVLAATAARLFTVQVYDDIAKVNEADAHILTLNELVEIID